MNCHTTQHPGSTSDKPMAGAQQMYQYLARGRGWAVNKFNHDDGSKTRNTSLYLAGYVICSAGASDRCLHDSAYKLLHSIVSLELVRHLVNRKI